jgi:hypothetical protein
VVSQMMASLLVAGTGANDATVTGTGWTNPGNVTADDGSYATVTVALNAHSQYVKGTNFGFAVPGGATIVGIVAEVERNVPAGNAIDFSVRLFKAGVATGSDLAAYSWPATDAVATYGSSSELWGTTWTPADVNAATFGVGISVKGHSAFAVNPQVDYIKITVYYSTPSNLAVGGRQRLGHAVLLRRVRLPRHQRRLHRQLGTTIRKLVGTTFSTPAGMPKRKFVRCRPRATGSSQRTSTRSRPGPRRPPRRRWCTSQTPWPRRRGAPTTTST